ncbi:hypothetical protein [Methylorubrum populi]|uniref:hypothetical protein n=1 Tax=Methylorubrum populi TaxID=223967 RepID=UPI000DB3E927|nr:hypothetical protein [Methylorubrum populi]PZP71773.1 MAG: hypothetical protein DI590_05795 [Methylorubrum populi]
MKILVSTTGSFQLMNSAQEELVRADGLTVVQKSLFWGEHIAEGRVTIEGQVNDEASDAEWLETLRESDGNQDLALASFLDRYPVTAASARAPEPPPKPASTKQVEHNAPKKGRQASPAAPKQE